MLSRIKAVFKKYKCKIRFFVLAIKSDNKIQSRSFSNISSRSQFLSDGGRIIIGEKVTISDGSYLSAVEDGKIRIGNCVYINRNFSAVSRTEIEIGEGTSIGPNVTIYDHDHLFGTKHQNENGYKVGKVSIGKKCWIGTGVIILRGTIIGDGCVIGAGSIIKHNIPANTLVISGRDVQMTSIV